MTTTTQATLPTYDQLLSDIRSDKYDSRWFADRPGLKEKVIDDLTPEAYAFAAEVVAKLAHSRWTDYIYARKLWQVAQSSLPALNGIQREFAVEILAKVIRSEYEATRQRTTIVRTYANREAN